MQMLVFVGAPGAGKSTFYRRYFFDSHLRINLDQLRTRHRERVLIAACFESKTRFVWDNTNATQSVRCAVLERARSANFAAIAYYFEPDFARCTARNARRKGRARVPVQAIGAVMAQLQKPSFGEGFSAIFVVRNDENGFHLREVFSDDEI